MEYQQKIVTAIIHTTPSDEDIDELHRKEELILGVARDLNLSINIAERTPQGKLKFDPFAEEILI